MGSSYQEKRVGIQLSERRVDPVIKKGGLIQLSERRVDPVIKKGGPIQLSERRVDPVIKKGGLIQLSERRDGIQLSREECWDPINRFNPAIFLWWSQATTWISNVTCHGPFGSVSSVKMRGDFSFC